MPEETLQSRSNEQALLEIVEQTMRDLRGETPIGLRVALNCSLDRDLGFDSLARVELLLRIERAFGISLPEDTLARAESVHDLLNAVEKASPSAMSQALRVAQAPMVGPESTGLPDQAATLLDVLDWHVAMHPDKGQIIYLADDEQHNVTYRQLAAGADAIASGLQKVGMRSGQSVSIMLPTSPEYFQTYFGILRAGGVPVPIYPPARMSQLQDHVLRHTGILANAKQRC